MNIDLVLIHAAKTAHVSFELLRAICTVESNLNYKAYKHSDGKSASYGLCQVKEATAIGFGFTGDPKQLLDADINAYYAARYLEHQLGRYDGDWVKAISAYNAGTASKSNGTYVRKVLQKVGEYVDVRREIR